MPGFNVALHRAMSLPVKKSPFNRRSAVTRFSPRAPTPHHYVALPYCATEEAGPVANGAGGTTGAQFIGVRVDALVREGNRVTGVQAGDDILDTGAMAILTDGVNSMLGVRWTWCLSLLRITMPSARKELIGLSGAMKSALIWRPLKAPHDLSLARPQRAHGRRVSLYQPRFGFSGAGMWHGRLLTRQKRTANAGKILKQHPAIRQLIRGGTLLEYSAHMVARRRHSNMPELANDGVMIVGDAAGLCLVSVIPSAAWI